MYSKSRIIGSIAGAAVIAVVFAGDAAAQKLKAAGPQEGDCKRAYETVVGQSAPVAQAMWTQMVAGKFGTKWAHWVGAQNKTLIPVVGGQNPMFQARAQPCFYQPVP